MGYYKRFIAVIVSTTILFAIFLLQVAIYKLSNEVNSRSNSQTTQAHNLPANDTDQIASFERHLSPKNAILSEPLFAQETITDSLIYLQSSQNADGSWGGDSSALNGIFPTTAYALQALQVAEPEGSIYQEIATQFIVSQTLEATPFIAGRLLALAKTEEDTSADLGILLSRQNEDGGWGTSAGYQSNVWDTALVVSAVRAAGNRDTLLFSRALYYLRRAQNVDGGWGLLQGEESHVFYTALVLQTLSSLDAYFYLDNLKGEAVAYLRSQQQPDGGYGTPDSTPFETALAAQAILGSKLPLTAAEDDALSYLSTQQQINGSWVDDPYSTALALRTLLVPLDTDADGMSDACETTYNLDINDPADAIADNDSDGLPNLIECQLGTNPTLSDSDGDSVSDPIELSCFSDPLDVADFNRPPQITSLPVTSTSAGELYTYQMQATDADGGDLTFGLLAAPSGMDISATGLISWTPGTSDSGTFNIAATVIDERGCQDRQPFHLAVLAQGIDLIVNQINTEGLTTDVNSLVALGSVQVIVQNIGGSAFAGQFDLTLFEDSNGNGIFDEDSDTVLGIKTFSGAIASNDEAPISVNISGIVQFRDNLIYAVADSNNGVPELDEANNLRHSGQESHYVPPVGQFQPLVEWQWEAPASTQIVRAAPIVSPLIDTNNDGLINERDVPAVIIPALSNFAGNLVALRGDTGEEIFSVAAGTLVNNAGPAVGDIDMDGQPEIIISDFSRTTLRAFDNTGAVEWSVTAKNSNGPNPYLGNLSGDERPEILYGHQAFDADGALLWEISNNYSHGPDGGALLADLDLDGVSEVIVGPSAHEADGDLLWSWRSYQLSGTDPWTVEGTSDGGATIETFTSTLALPIHSWPAVINVDSDPNPEVIVVTYGGQSSFSGALNDALWILEHDGRVHAGPFMVAEDVPNAIEYRLGAPTVADFDGDGEPEIAIASFKNLVDPGLFTEDDYDRTIMSIFHLDGTLLWRRDLTAQGLFLNNTSPASAFDFDGDGADELVYLDAQKLYILNGADGSTLYEIGASFPYHFFGYVTIADVDNDGNAEMIVPLETVYQDGAPPRNGVMVIGDVADNWGHARRIWNQWQYNVTNVNEDVTVPSTPVNNWDIYNNYRTQAPIAGIDPFAAPDLSISQVTFNQDLCPAGVGVTARIGNGGGLHVPGNLTVNFYSGDPATNGTLIGMSETTQTLYPGEYEDVTIDWTGPSTGDVFVTVNETTTPILVVSDNLALLPHTWAQSSGIAGPNNTLIVNIGAYNGIDNNNATGWTEPHPSQNHYTGPSWYEVHFPIPVNPVSVTVQNSFPNNGFITSTLSFSNGYTTTAILDQNGNGVVEFPQQNDITWIRITAVVAKANGGGLNEFIIAGSYEEPISLLHEGTGQHGNNKAAAGVSVSPCDEVTNQPPQIISSPPVTAALNMPFVYSVQALDPNDDAIAYALTAAPAGMTIGETTGLISWTPAATGIYSATVQANDNNGGIAEQSFIVEVIVPSAVNYAPEITSTPPPTITFGLTYTYDVNATDLNDDLLIYEAVLAPGNATIDSFTGELTWIPTEEQLGVQFFTISASDGLAEVVQSFNVTVLSAQIPLLPLPVDADNDGFDETVDCDDNNPNINPAQSEIPNNGLDDDCNAATPDTIDPAIISCAIVADKITYPANSLVQMTTTTRNLSPDLGVEGLEGHVMVTDDSAQQVYSDTVSINSLPPGMLKRSTVIMDTELLVSGAYTASFNLTFASNIVCQAEATFALSCAVPAAPTLNITQSGDDLLLEWSAVVGAADYSIYRIANDPYAASESLTLLATTSNLSYLDGGAWADTANDYYYVVRTDDACGESRDSNRVGKFVATVLPEWNLLSLPMITAGSSLDEVLSTQLYGTEDPTTADRVLTWDGLTQSFEAAWFCSGPVCETFGPDYYHHWLASDYSQSSLTILPNMGFWLQNRSGLTETLSFLGEVPIFATVVPVGEGYQLLGTPFLDNPALDEANIPATGTEDPTTADRIVYWDAAAQSFEVAWFCGGPVCETFGPDFYNHWLANDYSQSSLTLLPGHGFWYHNRHTAFIWVDIGP